MEYILGIMKKLNHTKEAAKQLAASFCTVTDDIQDMSCSYTGDNPRDVHGRTCSDFKKSCPILLQFHNFQTAKINMETINHLERIVSDLLRKPQFDFTFPIGFKCLRSNKSMDNRNRKANWELRKNCLYFLSNFILTP